MCHPAAFPLPSPAYRNATSGYLPDNAPYQLSSLSPTLQNLQCHCGLGRQPQVSAGTQQLSPGARGRWQALRLGVGLAWAVAGLTWQLPVLNMGLEGPEAEHRWSPPAQLRI